MFPRGIPGEVWREAGASYLAVAWNARHRRMIAGDYDWRAYIPVVRVLW